MTTYPLASPPHPGARKPMSVSATAAVVATAGTAAVAGTAVLGAGMAEWTPGDWAAWAGTVVFLGGAFVGGVVKILNAVRRDHVKLRTEVRQDVQQGVVAAADVAANAADHAAKRLEAAAAAMVPPQQMDELAERIAAKMRSPAPDGMTPDGRPKVGT